MAEPFPPFSTPPVPTTPQIAPSPGVPPLMAVLWPPPAVAEFHPPLRPNFGHIGKPIFLRANHFQVKIPNCCLYHYDITITPDKCPRKVNREIIEVLVNTHKEFFGQQKPVFDGRKNLYSKKALPIGRERVRRG
ncbi:Protein argonaute-1 [Geodia barretti]|uniref:Protein argonaute-1 n=1 Tax=Geodia barretti TaxID=519541 RepID=A0AA35SIX0_GEOBA|nr:Protein argonaute-1 [Geodia barretti]